MTWPPEQTSDKQISWTLQIQYKPGGWWSDHTDFYDHHKATEYMAHRRTANPQCRYRLIRITTTYTIETGT